jgi:hypothetical protein
VVAPVDNLSRLEGVLRGRRPHPTLAGYELVRLEVQATGPVDGRAHLLTSRQGSAVELAVPSRLLGEAATGDHVVCRARLTGRGLVVAAQPAADAFRVRRP